MGLSKGKKLRRDFPLRSKLHNRKNFRQIQALEDTDAYNIQK